MKLRIALAVLAVAFPAAASAAPDYNRMVATAQADPAQAASLYVAFCIKDVNATPKWICDQIRAAERPVLKRQVSTLKMK